MDFMGFLLECLALSYLLKMLVYQEKESHFGPFESKTLFVFDSRSNHTQPVTLFDWVRRSTIVFNPYIVRNDNVWEVTKEIERWECPFCLSFWMAFLFTFLNVFVYALPIHLIILLHLSIAMVSSIIVGRELDVQEM